MAHLIEKYSLNALPLYEMAKMRSWLDRLSGDTINRSPILSLLYAWTFQIFKDSQSEKTIDRLLNNTEFMLAESVDDDDSPKKALPTEYQRVKSLLAIFRLHRSCERGESSDVFRKKLNGFSPAPSDEPFIKCIYYPFKP